MKKIKFLFGLGIMCLWMTACGGPTVCDCDAEAIKEDPDDELLEKCREKLGGMEMSEVLKALERCS